MRIVEMIIGTAAITLTSKKDLSITVKRNNDQIVNVNDLIEFTLSGINYLAKVIEVFTEDKIIRGLQFKPNDFIVETKGDFIKMDINLFKPKLEIYFNKKVE